MSMLSSVTLNLVHPFAIFGEYIYNFFNSIQERRKRFFFKFSFGTIKMNACF